MGPKLNNPTDGPEDCSTSEGLQACVDKYHKVLDSCSTAWGQNDAGSDETHSDYYMPGAEAKQKTFGMEKSRGSKY